MGTQQVSSVRNIMVDAIIKHAGLSDWDREGVLSEVNAILRDLEKGGYAIVKQYPIRP